jgi:hypothetical protein
LILGLRFRLRYRLRYRLAFWLRFKFLFRKVQLGIIHELPPVGI